MDLDLFQQQVADELERKKAQELPQTTVADPTIPEASEALGVPVRPNLANFEERVSSELDRRTRESRAYLAGTLRENKFAPEQAAKAIDLSRKTNTPLFLFDSPEAVQKAERNAQIQDTIDRVTNAPLTGQLLGGDTWLTRAMSDSVNNIADVETLFKNSGFAEAARRQKMLEDRETWDEYRERERTVAPAEGGASWAAFGRAFVSGATEGVAISGRGYAELRRMLTRLPGAGLFLTAEDVVASGLTGQTIADTASESAKALQQAAQDLRGTDEGYIYDVTAALGQLIPQVVFYATSPAAGTTNLFAQGVGIMSEKIEGDDADPATMDIARLVGGATTAITSRLPMEALLGRISPQLKSELATALARIGIAAGAEGAQEIVENLIMDTTRILLTNPDAEIELREALYEGAVGAGAGGIFRALLEAALGIKRRGGRDQAEADGEQLQQIFDIIRDTPARERSPETFGQLISQITEDATVYVTPQALQEAAAQTGVELPSATIDQINEAIGGMGSGVEVKLGELATAYAGTPVERLLLDNTRRTPEGLTLAEARVEQENALNQFAEEAERIIARQTERQAFAESADRVRDSFKTALESTGKYQPQQVDSFSRLMRAYYATTAARLGITPEQLRDGWVDANGVQHRGYMPSFVTPDTAATAGVAFNQQATPELFTRANIGRIMEARDWAVITAENPNAQALSPEENAARNEQLKADLDAMGIRYIEGAVGKYGTLENPLILLGVSPAQAQELAQRYEQESALTPAGLVYQDGTVNPGRGVEVFDTAPEDFFTTLPDGTMFSMDIDFSQRVPLAETEYAQRLEGLAGDVPQQSMADREALRVEQEFDAWIDADPEAAVDVYLEAFGNEINTDLAREFSPAYKGNPSRWSAAVHEPASRLARLAYARVLGTLPEGSTVVFSGGGGGSGKGFALRKTGIKAQADAVYDLTMANYASTKAKIEQALAAGMKVQIAFVRTPFEVAITRAIERTKTEGGRVVTVAGFAEAHVGAPATFNAFLSEYAGNENVEITLIDNTETPTLVESATLESPDYNQIVERFQDEINRQLENGEISQEIANAYLVGSDGQILAGQSERDAGGVRGLRGLGDREAGQEFGQAADRLTRPPVNADGSVTLWHYGKVPNISELDPAMSGTGIAGADIRRRDADPDNWVNRTYYGIAIGQPGGYKREPGLGVNLYRVEIPAEQMYDMAADPDGLRPTRAELSGWDNLTSVFERRIKEAGYKGYWANSQQLGLTAAVFEKKPARQVTREEAPDGAFGQSRRQTETAEFKRWFGDSKVVDENGEPLVVYHGSSSEAGVSEDGIFAFNSTENIAGWFSPSSEKAMDYAVRYEIGEPGESGPQIYSAYLRIENALEIPGEVQKPLRDSPEFVALARSLGVEFMVDPEKLDSSFLVWELMNDAEFTDGAIAAGYDGLYAIETGEKTFAAFRPEQIKSAIGNRGTFDPANPDITRQDRRGEFAPQTMEIRLLADADASTFIHESAHFMLTMMTDLALDPNAPADVRADVEVFLKQIGFEGTVEEWAAKPISEQREAHETFAESFEQYIFTGKAPTKELQGLFRRLADFMKRVYRDLRSFLAGPGQRAKLNPELSRLFDRLLATEAEIEGASRERAYEAFFASAAEAGMTPEQFAEYIALDPEHRAQAEEALRALMLRDLKGEAAERRAEVKAEVEAELSQEPVYRAMLWLRRGKFFENGELVETPAGLSTNKLSIPVLKEMFPNVTDWAKLGYGKYGMLANEGLHPDLVAPLLGFESGDAMVKALLDAPSLSEAVETRTNEVMFERYNDLASPENMARAVDEAMHNDAGLERLAAEISTLYGRVGSKSRLLTAARQYAKAIVESKTSRTLRPADFSAAELRAGKAAIEALRRGDRAEALKQKRIELLNHAAAMEAHKASREMDKMAQRMRSIARKGDDTSAVKSRDGDMVAATRALLSAYGLGTPRVQQAAGEYLKRLKEYDPGKADFLEAELTGAFTNAKDWRTLTVGEMRELNSLVSDLWTDARESRTITVNGEKVEIDAAAEALVERMSKKPDFDKTRGTTEALTWKDKLAIQFGSIKGRFNRVLPWTGMMDRGRDGPWRQYLWRALVEPSDAFRARRVEVVTNQYGALVEKYKHLFKNETKIDGREIGYTFTGNAELVAALLHTGNESNLRKLLLGGRPDSPWGDVAQDGKTLDRTRWDRMVERLTSEGKITKDHWDFVQGVWDILESIKPDAQRAHRSLFGRFFNEITASPVQTPFGEYRGGYFPAVTDPSLIKSDTLRRQLQNENQTFSYAMPDKGFTKERVEYNRPLMLDMRVVSSHIDKVLMFSYLAKPVSDVRRLMMRENVSTNLERVQPGAMENMILPYLDRIANQKIETPSETGAQFDAIVRAGRRNTAMTYMFANLTNTLLQFTGAPLSMLKVPTGALLRAQADIVMNPKDSYEFIKSKSPFMAERLTNSNALMYDNMQEILTNPSVYEKAQNWAARNAYITQIWADRAISTTVWLGAYNHAFDNAPGGMTETGRERYARQQADDAVRQTQMDQSPEGIAAFEAGTPFQRLFTQFMGYFNMWATVIAEEGRVAQFKGDWMRLGFIGVVGLMIVPALGEVIRLVLAGGPEDDEGDGYLDDWLRSIGWGMLKFYGAAVPYAGALAVGAIAPVMDDPFAARALTPPVAGAVESVGRAVKATAKMAEGEDVKPSQMIRAMANTINLFTGLPTGGLARPVGYAADVEAGYIVPTDRTDYIRGILTGIASPESK